MTYPKNFRKYIRELASHFRKQIFHGEYDMIISYIDDDEKRKGSRHLKFAEIDIDTKYLSFNLIIYPVVYEKFKEKKYWEVANTICHEICHLLTEPLYIMAYAGMSDRELPNLEEVRERQTQRFCNVIMNGLPKKIWEYKKVNKPRKSKGKKHTVDK